MADVSDVENVLVSTITNIIYPTGTASPSIVTAPCKIYRGWPIPDNLNADLAAGTINVSVFPQGIEQKTTRYPNDWQTLNIPTTTLTVANTATTITIGGTPSSPLNVAAIVNGIGYVYAVQPSDTPSTIATGLAALINVNTTATSTGPVITIPAASAIATRIGTVGTIIREIKRQNRGFLITFWCPNPTLRDAIVPPIDAALADTDFLLLPDGSSGRLIYKGSPVTDSTERAGLYRRDLAYMVEYATTDTQSVAQIVTQLFNLTGGLDTANPAIKSFSI